MITVQAKEIAETALWAYSESDRPHLNGVLFGDGRYVATDGHRMVVVPNETATQRLLVWRDQLLAACAVAKVVGAYEMKISVDAKHVVVDIGAMKLRAISGEADRYPPIQQVFDSVPRAGIVPPEGYTFNAGFLAAIDSVNRAMGCDGHLSGVQMTGWSDALSPVMFENRKGVKFIVIGMRGL